MSLSRSAEPVSRVATEWPVSAISAAGFPVFSGVIWTGVFLGFFGCCPGICRFFLQWCRSVYHLEARRLSGERRRSDQPRQHSDSQRGSGRDRGRGQGPQGRRRRHRPGRPRHHSGLGRPGGPLRRPRVRGTAGRGRSGRRRRRRDGRQDHHGRSGAHRLRRGDPPPAGQVEKPQSRRRDHGRRHRRTGRGVDQGRGPGRRAQPAQQRSGRGADRVPGGRTRLRQRHHRPGRGRHPFCRRRTGRLHRARPGRGGLRPGRGPPRHGHQLGQPPGARRALVGRCGRGRRRLRAGRYPGHRGHVRPLPRRTRLGRGLLGRVEKQPRRVLGPDPGHSGLSAGPVQRREPGGLGGRVGHQFGHHLGRGRPTPWCPGANGTPGPAM